MTSTVKKKERKKEGGLVILRYMLASALWKLNSSLIIHLRTHIIIIVVAIVVVITIITMSFHAS